MALKTLTKHPRTRSNSASRIDVELDVSRDNSVVGDDSPVQKKVRWEGSTGEEESDEEDNVVEKVCLAGFCQHGRIGCAYYDPVKCILFVLEDTQDTAHFDLANMLLDQADAEVILTSSRADEKFIDFLRDYMEACGGTFQIRPHKDFIAAKGRDRILSLPLFSDFPADEDARSSDVGTNLPPKNAYDFMRKRRDTGEDPTTKKWNASIRLANFACADSALCMSSVGALLDYLVREKAVSALEDEGISGLEIRNIEIITLDRVMQINGDALFSLQIFEDETHASIHSEKTKEGLSLFATLDKTKTSLGRSLLRTWLLRPSLLLPVISARHDAVDCFLRSENVVTASVMHNHLKGIKNVPRILGLMRTGRAKTSDWQGLVKFTFHAAMLRDVLGELHGGSGVEIISRLINALDITSFRDVGTMVNETIDWEESTDAGRVCVRPYIDEDLDNRKQIYRGIDSVLSKVAEQICEAVPLDYASSLNVVYFPQLGFLICIPMLDEWRTEKGIEVIDGWSFQFSSHSHVYFKSQEMHDMDTHIGDLHPLIVDREIEIVQDLLERILVYDEAMGHACDVCAELDCLLSFAEASKMYEYRRPEMVDENVIDIRQGRHPLQEQAVNTFVPNNARVVGGVGSEGSPSFARDGNGDEDEWISRDSNSVILCTGANACGKSVYLKQIALIQYMAQIGCFIPAESATLGVVDKIFTRIQTRESVSKVQSAFMIDLNQVSLALRNSTARSLILLDEFGKGTLSTDGAGLLCGVLKTLIARGPECPKVLVATHFHEIFRQDLLDPERMPITFLHMEVMFTAEDGEVFDIDVDDKENDMVVKVGERIIYLHRIAHGLSLASHAAKCAQLFGIPRRICERAEYVSHLMSTHELGLLLDEEMDEEETKDLEESEAICRNFLRWDVEGEDGKNEISVKKMLAQVLGREETALI